MTFPLRRPTTALAMVLAGATLAATALPELTPGALKVLTQQQAARAAQAKAYLEGIAPSLGLTVADTFTLRHALTNMQGECVARFDQRHAGTRVDGACIIVKVEPDGTFALGASSLVPGLAVTPAGPTLSPAEAVALMTTKVGPTVGYVRAPLAEPVIFPASRAGSLVLARNPATGLVSMDPLRSAEGIAAEQGYVRAYRIVAELVPTDGGRNLPLSVTMEAETGAILHRGVDSEAEVDPFKYATGYPTDATRPVAVKVSATAATAPLVAPLQGVVGTPTTTLVPTVGYGRTHYFGVVPIPTTFDPVLNGYGLLDTTRGAAGNQFILHNMGWTDTYGVFHPNTVRPSGNIVLASTGLNTWVPYTMDGVSGSLTEVTTRYKLPDGHLPISASLQPGVPATTGDVTRDNFWGNGQDFVPTTDDTMADGAFEPAGKTAAAEAMNTMTCAYEFMKWAFNRTGVDGSDSGMTALVNNTDSKGQYYYETRQAYEVDPVTGDLVWVPMLRMTFGAGNPAAGSTSMAEPTFIGQVIGNMLWEQVLGYAGNSSIFDYRAVQRGFANLMSQGMYSLGSLHGMSRRAVMPTYIFGQVYPNGGYTFSMSKPSVDGVSPDAYYDGSYFIGGSNATWAAGPMNRAYFFMAEGASSSSSSRTYSEFLPGGMEGIGLEKTCKIAYKAITEELATPFAGGMEMRAALLRAAANLYGSSSPEVMATANAWAAANIGGASGAPDPIRVRIDMKNFDPNSDMGANGPANNARSDRYPWVPAGEPTQMKAVVEIPVGNTTTDTGLTWSVDPAPFSSSGFYNLDKTQNGQVTPDGMFRGPLRQGTGSINVTSIQARSKADPRQWSQGMVFNLAFDWDGDGGNDALDVGMLGLAYGIPFQVLPAMNDTIFYGFPGVSEGEIQMALAAFKTAFGN